MYTKRQKELAQTFLSALDDETRPIYEAIFAELAACDYFPQKNGKNLSFKHARHNKQMAKAGIAKGPFFALRFSGCHGYSQRIDNVVRDAILRFPSRTPGCVRGNCSYCNGTPMTHVYTHTFPDGEARFHCGAYVMEIPNLAAEDVPEIQKMIREEHDYLMKHEASACIGL